jgi:hypothetical protein
MIILACVEKLEICYYRVIIISFKGFWFLLNDFFED